MTSSNYLVKMSNTGRNPPKRITPPRKAETIDNIAQTAKLQQCYLHWSGITEISRQLRAENAKRLCNSRLRGAGERISLATVCKDPPPPSYICREFQYDTLSEYAMNGRILNKSSKPPKQCNRKYMLSHRLIIRQVINMLDYTTFVLP